MKILNTLSVLGLVALMSACGSSNSNTSQLGSTGCNTTLYGCQAGSFTGVGGYTTTLYGIGNQILGTKTTTPILMGVEQNGMNTTFQESVTVNVGDTIVVNLQGASVSAQVSCQTKVLGLPVNVSSPKQESLSSVSVTLNGSSLLSGSGQTIAQVAGTLEVSGSYSSLTSCTNGTLLSPYTVNFGSIGIYTEHCVNTAGGAMSCPN